MEDGDHGEDEEQQIPRIPIDWDFSHLDGIIETVLQQKPDHNVYLYGSVESAYDSSRPGADVADQAPFTSPCRTAEPYSFSWESKQSKVEENLMNFEELIILGLLLVGEYLGVGMKSSSFQDYNREDEIIGSV